jgi:type I restriction enzyme S subunit
MKDSGIQWIGEIPEHWSVLPIKYTAKIGNGSTPKRDETRYWEGGHFPWLASGCVNEDCVEKADEFVTDAALRECHLPIVVPPAVLIGITGQGKTRGMATTLRMRATVNQHLAFLSPDSDVVDVDFLRRVIDSAYEWLRDESDGVGGTKGAITCEDLGNTRLAVPPVDEQQSIVKYLERAGSRLADLVEKTEASVRLLGKRRSALITAAVTGQIDLRGAV